MQISSMIDGGEWSLTKVQHFCLSTCCKNIIRHDVDLIG